MTTTIRTLVGIAASASACVALLSGVAAGQDQKILDKAVQARQGLMQIHSLESGPLFAMAKGDIAYDAAVAEGHAKALNELVGYDETRLFLPGSSNAEMSGKTWALPVIWEKPDEFHQAFENLREATTELAAQAGEGPDAMRPAVVELGKACGNCHETFRQKQ